MTWTYSGDPAGSTRDAIRFAIGDTISTDPQLTDEEIAYAITQRASAVGAALFCCDALIARYTRLVTQSVGSVSASYSDRLKQYKVLRGQIGLRGPAAIPFAGGTTVSGKEEAEEDEDREAPSFSVGQFDRTDY